MMDSQLSSYLMAETQVPQTMPIYDFDFSTFDDALNRENDCEENLKAKAVAEVDDILLDGVHPSMDYDNFGSLEDFNMCLSSILSDENDDQWDLGIINSDVINICPDQGKNNHKLVHHQLNLNSNENPHHTPSLTLSPSLSSTSTASILDEPSMSLGDIDDGFRDQITAASADVTGDRNAGRCNK